MALKFEHTAEVGDVIKAYDFEPMEGRPERYVIGRVVRKGWVEEAMCKGYVVQVFEDTAFPDDSRSEVLVPFQVSMLEYDTRVTVVK